MDNTHIAEIVFLAVCFGVGIRGDGIQFSASPHELKPLLTETMSLRCSLSTSANSSMAFNITALYSIAITKDGVDVGSVSQQYPASALGPTDDLVGVSGQITSINGDRGYLELTYKYPTSQRAGNYVCDVTGVDEKGHGHILTKTVKVLANEVAFNDLVNEIHNGKLEREQLQSTINNQNQTITDLLTHLSDATTTLDHQNDIIKAQNSSLRDIIKAQATSIAQLNQQLSSIRAKQNVEVHFTVALNDSTVLTGGDTVIYKWITHNAGNGYNSTSGQFVCPQSGEYLFILHVRNTADKRALLEFNYNHDDYRYFSPVSIEQGHNVDSASNSAVFDLKKGDTVEVRSVGESHLYGGSYDHYNTFTGVLLSPD